MLPPLNRQCCQNCEHLRIDNFCLIKGKYILSKNAAKYRDCAFFSSTFYEENVLTQRRAEQEEIAKKIFKQ